MREEFEKLPKVAEILLDHKYEVVFNELKNEYTAPIYSTCVPDYIYELNFGWYAFQEQQKIINPLKAELNKPCSGCYVE